MSFGNPFEENGKKLIHLTSKYVMSETAATSVLKIESVGKEQYKRFIANRLETHSTSFYSTI